MKETLAQKRDRQDTELSNEIITAGRKLMELTNKARKRGLYVSGLFTGIPYDAIRLSVRRDFKHKSKIICDTKVE